MTLDFSLCRLPPFQHQREDAEWLVNRHFAFIASEMRTGKTKLCIDTFQFLYAQGKVDKVIIVTPSPVRDVWFDPQLGELHKHLWNSVHATVTEYHSRIRTWRHGPTTDHPLDIYVTNFEYLRDEINLKPLLKLCGGWTLLIGDESAFLKNWTAQQTKSFYALRRKCARVWLLNGTPIYHTPFDLFSQGNLLSPDILHCKFVTLFKARYALQTPVLRRSGEPLKKVITKGKWSKEIIIHEITGWTNLEDLQRRFAPHTVRRLQKDCLDLPPKLDPITLTATLTNDTWKAYKQMRDDLVIWLQNERVVTSSTAAIKVLKLAQITGGFVMGAEAIFPQAPAQQGLLDSLLLPELQDERRGIQTDTEWVQNDGPAPTANLRDVAEDLGGTEGSTLIEIGREKLDVLLWLIERELSRDPNLHMVAWTRFRAELLRMVAEVKKAFPQMAVGTVIGEQSKKDRHEALALLHPDTSPEGPVFVGGIEGTGSFGLNMTAARVCVTMSMGYSIGKTAQTLDRVYGPGQKNPISYYNIIAVGPKGQYTVDRDILLAQREGEDIAQRTVSAWVKALGDVQ